MSDRYRPVSQLLRPPRALLAYEANEHWQAGARASIRAASRWWGGAGAAVLPYSLAEPTTPSPAVLRAVRGYDPDLLCWVYTSAEDLAPAEYQALVDEAVAGGKTPLEAAEAAQATPLGAWAEPTGLLQLAEAWFAHRQPYGDYILRVGRNDTPEPLADADEIAEGPQVALDLGGVSPALGLLLATALGDVRPDSDAVRVPVTDAELTDVITLALSGTVEAATPDSWRAALSNTGVLDPFRLLPLRRTMLGARWYTRGRSSFVLVVGDTADDHALAVALDRGLAAGAAWVPAALVTAADVEGRAVRDALQRRLRQRTPRSDTTCIVTSASLPTSTLEELTAPGGPLWTPANITVQVQAAETIPLEWQRTLVISDSAGYVEEYDTAVTPDGTLTMRAGLRARRPTGDAANISSWYVEANVAPLPATPSRGALAEAVISREPGGYDETLSRTSYLGVAYWCRTQGFRSFAMADDVSLVRPQLRRPGALDIFAELADAAGCVASISPAGRRARNVVELWGTLAEAIADLTGSHRGLFDAFTAPVKDGPYSGGIAVRRTGYVTLDTASTAAGLHQVQARQLLDRLLLRRIVHRGLLLRCQRCERLDFYRITHVGNTFTCQQCEHENALTQARWHKPVGEPTWCYDLDPVVRDLLAQNGDVPMLTVGRLGGSHVRAHVDASFEIELTRTGESKPWVELDIAAIVDRRIVVGEAKSNNALRSGSKSVTEAAQRLVEAAAALTADTLVLATAQQKWSSGVEPAVRHALSQLDPRRPRPELVMITDVR